MKPNNYFPSLEQRISFAVAKATDVRELEALIAETELSLADAPDPESLRTLLSDLKQTHTTLVRAG